MAEIQPTSLQRTDTGVDFGNDAFLYELNVPKLRLTAGEYALEVVDNSSGDPNDDWYWLTSCDLCGGAFVRQDDNSPWGLASNTLALRVSGAVPEPDGLILMSAFVMPFFGRRWRIAPVRGTATCWRQ